MSKKAAVPDTSVIVPPPARVAVAGWAPGGIMRSSLATDAVSSRRSTPASLAAGSRPWLGRSGCILEPSRYVRTRCSGWSTQ